jgi:hypothetical protein
MFIGKKKCGKQIYLFSADSEFFASNFAVYALTNFSPGEDKR